MVSAAGSNRLYNRVTYVYSSSLFSWLLLLLLLTLEAVGIEQILALFVAFDAAFGAADTLASDAPE